MSKYLKSLTVLGLITLILVGGIGSTPITADDGKIPGDIPEVFTSVLITYKLINEEYREPEEIDNKKLVRGAIKGMLESLPDEVAGAFTKNKLQELTSQEISQEKFQPVEDLKPAVEIYQDVLDETRQKETLEKKQLIKEAISGMLDALGDNHSAVYTREEYKEYTRGQYIGLGMELERAKGQARILATYPDTPASRSSIRPGDLLLKIDGKSINGMSSKNINSALTGEKGTKLELTIKHQNGEQEVITLIRRKLNILPVEYELLPERKIALFDINQFLSATPRKLKGYLKKMERKFLKPNQEEQQNDLKEMGKIYGLLGNAYSDEGKYEKAMKYYGYAREFFEKNEVKAPVFLAQTYDNLGSAYQKEEELGKAIKYHEKALEAYREFNAGKNHQIAKTHGNIGNAYFRKGNFGKAIESSMQSVKILEEGPESEQVFLAQAYSDLGVALKNAGKIDKAIKRQKQAMEIFEEVSGRYPDALVRVYGALASAYREKGKVDKTMNYYKKQSKAKRETPDKKSQVNLHPYGNLAGGYDTKGSTKKALEDYKKQIMSLQGFQGIIIDLRNNPGGMTSTAISALSEFVDRGLVTQFSRGSSKKMEYESLGNSVPDFPLAVLINGGTASAAELFAASIKDREKGVLVGRSSSGKSSVQTIYKISNGFFWVKLTTGEYYTPSGDKVLSNGLKPDLSSPEHQEDIPLAIEWISEQKVEI
ncbi:tetratricopeptide repeat protein [Candidatus Bipolaricaulota bacterium]|nr:tetratricopeptide repeat protein [Candidatus Bipolaricaulota bacterium]